MRLQHQPEDNGRQLFMQKRIRAGLVAGALAVTLILSGCGASNSGQGHDQGEGSGEKGKITFGMFSFDELIAITNLWSVILEDKGYDVEIKTADKAPVFVGLSDGAYDAVLSVWSEADSMYIDRYGDDMVDLGSWNDEASLTVAVNADAPVDSLEDLAAHASEFDDKLVGIEAGAALTSIVEKKVIPEYGLEDMDFLKSSTPAMLAELKRAMSSEEPIAVTLWRPHWAYGAYDLKDLKDSAGALGEEDSMNVFGSQDIESKHPEVAEWLGDFTMETAMLHGLENQLFNKNDTDDYEPIVREWMSNNQEYVDSLTG